MRSAKLLVGVIGTALVIYGLSTGYFDLRPDHLVYSYGGRVRLPWPMLLTFFLGFLIGSALLKTPDDIAVGERNVSVMESFGRSDTSSRSYAQIMAGITAGVVVTAACIFLSVMLVPR